MPNKALNEYGPEYILDCFYKCLKQVYANKTDYQSDLAAMLGLRGLETGYYKYIKPDGSRVKKFKETLMTYRSATNLKLEYFESKRDTIDYYSALCAVVDLIKVNFPYVSLPTSIPEQYKEKPLNGFIELLLHSYGSFSHKDIPIIKELKLNDKITNEISKPFVVSLFTQLFVKKESFVGRISELNELEIKLQTQNTIFLSGIGGIGKSELARQYIASQTEYEIIVYVKYTNSLARDMMQIVKGFDYQEIRKYREELKTDEAIFENILFPKLQELLNSHVLLFIDNFDTDMDLYLEKIINELECKKIITTRYDYTRREPERTILIGQEQDVCSLKKLFYDNGPIKYRIERDDDTDNHVNNLIESLNRHTLAIKLLANQIRESSMEFNEAIIRFKKSGYKGEYETPFYNGLSSEEKTAYGHIRDIFKFSDIKGDKLEFLKVLTYIPLTGIDQYKLRKWCGFIGEGGKKDLNALINWNWILQNEIGMLSLHPVISEVLWRELKPKLEEGLLQKYKINLLANITNEDITIKNRNWFLEIAISFILRTWENTKNAVNTVNTLYKCILYCMDISEPDSLLDALKAITPIVLKKYSPYTTEQIIDIVSTEVLDFDDDDTFTKQNILEPTVLLAQLIQKVDKDKYDLLKRNFGISTHSVINAYYDWFNHEYINPIFLNNSEPNIIGIDNTTDSKMTKNMTTINIKTTDGSITKGELVSCFELKSTNKYYLIYTIPTDKFLVNGLVKLRVAEIINENGLNAGTKMDNETWENIKEIMKRIVKGDDTPEEIEYIEFEFE